MFQNLVKVALRSIIRDLRYNVLIFLGLVIGITGFAVIFMFVRNERSFDDFHPGAKDLYRITTQLTSGENERRWAITNGYLNPLLEEKVVGVETVTMLQSVQSSYIFEVEGRLFSVPEGGGFMADPDFFKVFSGFQLIHGDPSTALAEPDHIVLTESEALKYFGRKDVLGETVVLKSASDDDWILTVSGVARDIPPNSHLVWEYLMAPSPSFWERLENVRSGGFPLYVYFRTTPSVNQDKLRADIQQVTEEAYPQLTISFPVQPVTEIHFNANNLFEHTEAGNENFIQMLFLVGILMLMVAAINYVILGTAKSLQRVREIGIRKALGSSRSSLVAQILIESALLGLVAASASVLLAEFVLNTFIASQFGVSLSLWSESQLVVLILLLGMILGAVSVLFLSFGITRISPVDSLRGRYSTGTGRGFSTRDVLVTSQFTITAALLIASLIIFRQIDFLRTKDLGYTTELALNIPRAASVDIDQFKAFRQAIDGDAVVEGSGLSLYEFISDYNATSIAVRGSGREDTLALSGQWNAVDPGLIPAMEVELVEGRNFSLATAADSSAVIINEAARRMLGLDEAVGSRVLNNFFLGGEGEIIGVVKDYHFQSFDNAVTPVVLYPLMREQWIQNMVVRISTSNVSDALTRLENHWVAAGIEAPFEAVFIDDWFESLIRREIQLGSLVTVFTILSLVVAGLGLIGLISFSTERRRKEIGIRKVVGASASDILLLINRRYLLLLVIALVVAVPVSLWALRKWLENFAYTIPISPTDFILASLALGVMAAATISITAYGAARRNPVISLRQE